MAAFNIPNAHDRVIVSGDEVAEIMESAPGSQTMREPTGWQAVSDEVAGERQRVALERSGREVASTSNNPQRIEGEES